MRPDVDVAYMSPRASLADVSTGSRLRVSMQAGPVSLIPRRIDSDIADALDALDPDVLPEFDVSGTIDQVCREIGSALGSRAEPETPVIAWLRRDVANLAGLFASVTGAERRGFSGGDQGWEQITLFFDRLKERAYPEALASHARSVV